MAGPSRPVMLVFADGRTIIVPMTLPFTASMQFRLFRTPTRAEMTITFKRIGGACDYFVLYEETSLVVKV